MHHDLYKGHGIVPTGSGALNTTSGNNPINNNDNYYRDDIIDNANYQRFFSIYTFSTSQWGKTRTKHPDGAAS